MKSCNEFFVLVHKPILTIFLCNKPSCCLVSTADNNMMVFLTRTLEFLFRAQIKVAINFILFVLFDLFAHNIKLLFSVLFALEKAWLKNHKKC